ncbi:MAG: hypothetical protein NC412_00480 [Roseburia sp.]|nr:hypothetical protein [Roseburia sp.]MCM1278593.1 hypothetical protein [Robinsoniella sp.]
MGKKKMQFFIMLCVVGIVLPVLSVCAYSKTYETGIVMKYDLRHSNSLLVARTYNTCVAIPQASVFVYDSNGTALRSDLQRGKWDNVKLMYLATAAVSDSSAKSAKSAHVLLRSDGTPYGETLKLTW